jgi:simple sugar transport system permease protein
MSSPLRALPAWADVALIPLLNVAAAFFISGLVVLAIGENPIEAVKILISGALGDLEGVGFTLYYATSFIFTGLAVAICFHAGHFNIGVEGQAYVAGLGAALAALYLGFLPGYSLVVVAILAAALFGAAFAAIPGYLQAKRDSHIVITTIMFNYIASALMGYLLVDVLRVPSQMNAETRQFPPGGIVPQFHELLKPLGIVSPARITIITTLLSGALSGGLAVNVILGEEHRLILEFTAGFGFVGIAVALMGRAHPVGIILAAILFGVLYQGGAELAFDKPKISRDMIIVIQGLVVLFAGALEHMFRRPVAVLLARRTAQPPI